MMDRDLSQARLAEYAGTSPSQFSKILKFQVNLSFTQLSNIATNLNMSELDIITYPEHYVSTKREDDLPEEVQVILRISKDKQDRIMNILYGQHDIEVKTKNRQ